MDDGLVKTVVLAEKPSVGRELARVLKVQKKGNGYLRRRPRYREYGRSAIWSHWRTLRIRKRNTESSAVEDPPIIPEPLKLVVIKKTRKTVSGGKIAADQKRCQRHRHCNRCRPGRRARRPLDHRKSKGHEAIEASVDFICY